MKDNKQRSEWEDCRTGSISEFVEQRQLSRWQSFIAKISTSIVAGAAVVTLCTVFLLNSGVDSKHLPGSETNSQSNQYIRPISCENTKLLLPAYSKRRLCNRAIVERIREHLKNCENCNAEFQELFGCNQSPCSQ